MYKYIYNEAFVRNNIPSCMKSSFVEVSSKMFSWTYDTSSVDALHYIDIEVIWNLARNMRVRKSRFTRSYHAKL